MLKPLFYIALFNILAITALAQDTLPNLLVRNKSGKVIVSWVNPYKDIVLINIQRSPDSLKNFKTILTVTDPNAVTNGYLDSKAPNTQQFYRLYVQQSAGKYFFTNAFKPYLDTAKPKPKTVATPVAPAAKTQTAPKETSPPATREPVSPPPVTAPVTEQATPVAQNDKPLKPEKNSSQRIKFSNTKPIGGDSSRIDPPPVKKFDPPPVLIYTNALGQVIIALPEEKKNVYTLKFYTDSGTPVFTLNKIRDTRLTIEKTNFHNAGWYRCDLYENDKFRERYRIQIPKD